MFKTFIVCTVAVVVLAASATGSLRAEAVTNASPAGTAFAQDVTYGGYGRTHYPQYCGYYHYAVVVGGRRADGKVLIFCPSRIGECAISAFETR